MPIGYVNGEHVVSFGKGDIAIGLMAVGEKKFNGIGFVPIPKHEIGADVSYTDGMACPVMMHFDNEASLDVLIGRLLMLKKAFGKTYPERDEWATWLRTEGEELERDVATVSMEELEEKECWCCNMDCNTCYPPADNLTEEA